METAAAAEAAAAAWAEAVASTTAETATIKRKLAAAQLKREAEMMRELRFPLIVQLLGCCFVDPDRAMIVLELAPLGSLYTVLHQTENRRGGLALPLDLSLRLAIGADVAAAVSFLRSRGVVHRDIKSHNLLMFPGYVGLPRRCRRRRRHN